MTGLVWLPRAHRELHEAIVYIAQHDPIAALRQLDEIERQTEMLIEHPRLGRPGRVKKTRELVIGKTPLIAVYRVRPKAGRVEILRLLHGSRQWPPDRARSGRVRDDG